MFYLSSREHLAKKQQKVHITKNKQNAFFCNFCLLKFVYFWKVCVFFARAHIAFGKDFEVKHTIYVGWPK